MSNIANELILNVAKRNFLSRLYHNVILESRQQSLALIQVLPKSLTLRWTSFIKFFEIQERFECLCYCGER